MIFNRDMAWGSISRESAIRGYLGMYHIDKGNTGLLSRSLERVEQRRKRTDRHDIQHSGDAEYLASDLNPLLEIDELKPALGEAHRI
jgi:hypothetical protein